MAGAGAGKTYADFMSAQRARLVVRADLTRFKTGTGSDSFHSYDPREKVGPRERPAGAQGQFTARTAYRMPGSPTAHAG